jgi:hypothetical protein
VAKTGVERADSKTLTVVRLFADFFHCGALDNKHGYSFAFLRLFTNYFE